MAETVLITGASRGLGLELAKVYLKRGDTVVAGVRNPDSPALAALKREYSDALVVLRLDVGSTGSVDGALRVLNGSVGSIDVCVNNAAVTTTERFGTLETCNFEEALDIYNVNSLGPLRVTRAFLPLLARGARPVVVNISSEAGQITENPRGGEFEYCMSKAALNQATALLGRRLEGDGVRVLAVHPGWIRTDMGGQDATGDPAEAAEAVAAVVDRRRNGGGTHQFFDWENRELTW